MGRTFAILTASVCLTGIAQAATITPTTATASSQFPTYEAPFAIDTGGNRFVTDFAGHWRGQHDHLRSRRLVHDRLGADHRPYHERRG